jgi:predicted nucleic acid-binding protein
MVMTVFFDTNLFVYAVSHAPEDALKKSVATRLIAAGDFCLSVQVIQEVVNTCLSKSRLGQAPEAIAATARSLFTFRCAYPSKDQVLRALQLQQRYGVKYWDAAILAAAIELTCTRLYSEDLSHGQNYDGVTVINPFIAG